MTVIAGIDVGNATTEVVLVSGGKILGAGRVPTRGRKGSAGSLRGAAALVRRLERQLGVTIGEARIAPLRAADTAVVVVPDTAGPAGLRVLAAGVPTPGGTGACVGPPLRLGDEPVPGGAGPAGRRGGRGGRAVRPALRRGRRTPAGLAGGRDQDRRGAGGRRRGRAGGEPAPRRPAGHRPGRRGRGRRVPDARGRGAPARAHPAGAVQPGRARRPPRPGPAG